jgi:hypothetical protein
MFRITPFLIALLVYSLPPSPAAAATSAAEGSGPAPAALARAEPSPAPDPKTCRKSLARFADGMRPGQWLEIPDTAIAPVLMKRDQMPQPQMWGYGSDGVTGAWNSGAFDGCRWFVWGGGHKSYGGNEVYMFDVASLTWTRLTDPTPLAVPTADNQTPGLADPNKPAAGHTYDGLIWSHKLHKMLLWGSVTYVRRYEGLKWGGGDPEGWAFDPATRQWSRIAKHPVRAGYHMTAEDPETGNIMVCQAKECMTYLPSEDKFVSRIGLAITYTMADLTYDPKRHQFIEFGKNQIAVYPIVNGIAQGGRVIFDSPIIDTPGYGGGAVRGDSLYMWGGNTLVVSVNLENGAVRYHRGGPNCGDCSRPHARWVYLPDLDVFMGYSGHKRGWFLWKPDAGQAVTENTVRRIAPDGAVVATYKSLSEAALALRPNETLSLSPGLYREAAVIKPDGVTVKGLIGPNGERAHLQDSLWTGERRSSYKGAIVVRGAGVTVEGIECSGVSVPDGNAACIRIAGPDLTVRDVYFHDAQEGILGGGGGFVTVEDSLFERLGWDGVGTGRNLGRAHGMYVNDKVDAFTVRNARVLDTKGEGHGIKSKAARTTIENCVVDSTNGVDSRAIDISWGGVAEIEGNTLVKGANSSNKEMILFAVGRKAKAHGTPRATISGNRMVFKRPGPGKAVRTDDPAWVTCSGNTYDDTAGDDTAGAAAIETCN